MTNREIARLLCAAPLKRAHDTGSTPLPKPKIFEDCPPSGSALLSFVVRNNGKRMQFNEGKACDAVLRHLEARERSQRTNVRWPEKEHHAGPVELVCNIGHQLYALEHTGIEPFEGLVQLNMEDQRVFGPIEAAISPLVPDGEVWELNLPALGLQGRPGRETRQAQEALIDYIKNAAPTLQKRRYADYRGASPPVNVGNVPFPVKLYRFCAEIPRNVPGFKPLLIRHIVEGNEESHEVLRKRRIERACKPHRFEKLAVWKAQSSARTILILENADLWLTNEEIVARTFLEVSAESSNAPDEVYLFDTALNSRWYLWPLQIDEQTYFDIYIDTRKPLGIFSPSDLVSVTNR